MPNTPKKFKMVPMMYASDLPEDVLQYCHDNDVSTHYQSDVVRFDDDGNAFAEWLKSLGVPKESDGSWTVALIAT